MADSPSPLVEAEAASELCLDPGGIRSGGEGPQKRKEWHQCVCKQLTVQKIFFYFRGQGKGGDNPVSHNDLELNRIWQFVWVVESL